MVTIKEVTLVTDNTLATSRAQQLAADIGGAIATAWNDASGTRENLVVDRLSIEASGSELAQRGFDHTVARAAVERLLARKRGE